MEIRELLDRTDQREAVPIIRQLLDDANPDGIMEWTADDDYHLFGGFVDGELVGVASVLVTHVLHHAHHAWLYVLVVDEPRRGEGYGTALIEFVERWADERDCEFVALVSPLKKEGVHEYYRGQGYEKWGYVIERHSADTRVDYFDDPAQSRIRSIERVL